MKLSDLKADRAAESDGEWVDCPELGFDEASGEAVALKVRSLNYAPFKVELQQTMLRFRRRYPGDAVPDPDEEDRENGRLYAKHLLLDWRHIDPPFAPEIAREALIDVAQRALRAAVVSCARLVGQRVTQQADSIAGKSKPASDGSSHAGETTNS